MTLCRGRICMVAGLVVFAACSSEAAEPSDSDPSVVAATLPATRQVGATTTPSVQDARAASSVDRDDFVETFDGNVGLERFASDVFHRDEVMIAATSWSADHDMDCGTPDTQRTVHRARPDESFFVCRDHLMTSVGDTSGYSIAWFSPDNDGDGRPDVFSSETTDHVSWTVNVTELGARQWWEVVLVAEGTPFLTTTDWIAATANIEPYHVETIAVGTGPFGNDGNIFTNGASRDPLGWGHVSDADPEGSASKAIRRPFSIRDNGDGTITFEFLGDRYTYEGQFPERFEVYFKDHNYTPDKDGIPIGHTWHWDEISVK